MFLRVSAQLIVGLLLTCCAFAEALPDAKPAPRPKQRRPIMEISALGSVSRSSYGSGSYSKSTRLSGAVAVFLTATTEVEVSYTDARTHTNYEPAPKTITRTRDRILSLSLNQSLLPKSFFLQPYVKAGAAQLNRRQQTTYQGVEQPEQILKQPSGLLGAGVRLNVLWFLAIKFEVTTYLPNFHIRQARENYEWDAGVSFQF